MEVKPSENKHSLESTTQKKNQIANCTCVTVGNWCSNEAFDWKCDDRTTKKNTKFCLLLSQRQIHF